VVIDLTGNYEVLCRDIFYANGFINIHLADGKKINYFKRSKKHNLAKTDKMDSFVLSLYGKENIKNNIDSNSSNNGNVSNSSNSSNSNSSSNGNSNNSSSNGNVSNSHNSNSSSNGNVSNSNNSNSSSNSNSNNLGLKLYKPNDNTEDFSTLRAMESRLEEMKQLLVQEKNRLQAPNLDNFIKKDINLSLKQLESRIAKLEKESTLIVVNNEELKRKYNLLISQRGISSITAKILIAFLPELGMANKKQISSISGTAPICRDSGVSLKGYRSTKGTGRHILKKALFIVMLSHIRDEGSILNKFYNKLLKKGKAKKVGHSSLYEKVCYIS
jgi:hypothetical protein